MSRVLTVMLLTYGRLNYASQTLGSTLKNLRWDGELRVHIASDGDSDEYVNSLIDVARDASPDEISTSNAHRKGYGANYNLATQVIHDFSDYILPLEDDWLCIRELDASGLCGTLDALGGVACIRLGYLGFTQPLNGQFLFANGECLVRLDETSPEPHVFAGHPRIETKAWERFVGPWPEGKSPGETEFEVAHYDNARKYVYWPVERVKPSGDLFAHIGSVKA